MIKRNVKHSSYISRVVAKALNAYVNVIFQVRLFNQYGVNYDFKLKVVTLKKSGKMFFDFPWMHCKTIR